MHYSELPAIPGIYSIRSQDGELYIGSSRNIKTRCYRHFSRARTGVLGMPYIWMNAKGLENLECHLIEEFNGDRSDLYKLEKDYISMMPNQFLANVIKK